MAFPIVLSFDHKQNRIGRDWLMVMAEGSYKANRGDRQSGWDLINFPGCWQHEITFNAMLNPTWPESALKTMNYGVYAKYGVGSLTFSDSDDWEDAMYLAK
ncbi:MAG: hypothetical protein KF836_08640 [Fimbriimonadaceae bacterium]|nr:hypothetical protein [Fimbriimonadaceae bacterium]